MQFKKVLLTFLLTMFLSNIDLRCELATFPEFNELNRMLNEMPFTLNENDDARKKLKIFMEHTSQRRKTYISDIIAFLKIGSNKINVEPHYVYVKETSKEALLLLNEKKFRESFSGLTTLLICIKYIESFVNIHYKFMEKTGLEWYKENNNILIKLYTKYSQIWQGICAILLLYELKEGRVNRNKSLNSLRDADVDLWLEQYTPEKSLLVDPNDFYFKTYNDIDSKERSSYFRISSKCTKGKQINLRERLLDKTYALYFSLAERWGKNRAVEKYHQNAMKWLKKAQEKSKDIYKETKDNKNYEIRTKKLNKLKTIAIDTFKQWNGKKYKSRGEEKRAQALDARKKKRGNKKYGIHLTSIGYSIEKYKPMTEVEWNNAKIEAKKKWTIWWKEYKQRSKEKIIMTPESK